MGGLAPMELAIVASVAAVIALALVIPAVMICRKAGFSPWLGLLAAIPIVNVVLLWYVALVPWPSGRFATRRER